MIVQIKCMRAWEKAKGTGISARHYDKAWAKLISEFEHTFPTSLGSIDFRNGKMDVAKPIRLAHWHWGFFRGTQLQCSCSQTFFAPVLS